MSEYTRKIILESGEEYYGYGFGSDREKVLEIVFNTSMAGYQEIISDPSYTDQAVVMTYPLIGNYGMADEDYETEVPSIGALIVREYNGEPSSYRSRETLGDVMMRFGIAGIYGVDTRMIGRSIIPFTRWYMALPTMRTGPMRRTGIKPIPLSDRQSRSSVCGRCFKRRLITLQKKTSLSS